MLYKLMITCVNDRNLVEQLRTHINIVREASDGKIMSLIFMDFKKESYKVENLEFKWIKETLILSVHEEYGTETFYSVKVDEEQHIQNIVNDNRILREENKRISDENTSLTSCNEVQKEKIKQLLDLDRRKRHEDKCLDHLTNAYLREIQDNMCKNDRISDLHNHIRQMYIQLSCMNDNNQLFINTLSYGRFTSNLLTKNREIEVLQMKNHEKDREMKALQTSCNQQYESMIRTHREQSHFNTKLQNEYKKLQTDYNTLQSNHIVLHSKYNVLHSKHTVLQYKYDEIDVIRMELCKERNTIYEELTQFKRLTKKYDMLFKNYNDLVEKHEKSQKDHEMNQKYLNADMDYFQGVIQSLREEIRSLKIELTDKDTEIRTIKWITLQDIEGEMKSKRTEIIHLESTVLRQDQKIRKLKLSLGLQNVVLEKNEKNMCKLTKDLEKKDKFAVELNNIIRKRDNVMVEKDKIIQDKDKIIQEKDKIILEKDKENNNLKIENHNIIVEKDIYKLVGRKKDSIIDRLKHSVILQRIRSCAFLTFVQSLYDKYYDKYIMDELPQQFAETYIHRNDINMDNLEQVLKVDCSMMGSYIAKRLSLAWYPCVKRLRNCDGSSDLIDETLIANMLQEYNDESTEICLFHINNEKGGQKIILENFHDGSTKEITCHEDTTFKKIEEWLLQNDKQENMKQDMNTIRKNEIVFFQCRETTWNGKENTWDGKPFLQKIILSNNDRVNVDKTVGDTIRLYYMKRPLNKNRYHVSIVSHSGNVDRMLACISYTTKLKNLFNTYKTQKKIERVRFFLPLTRDNLNKKVENLDGNETLKSLNLKGQNNVIMALDLSQRRNKVLLGERKTTHNRWKKPCKK